jgi:hypothetical protein
MYCHYYYYLLFIEKGYKQNDGSHFMCEVRIVNGSQLRQNFDELNLCYVIRSF